MVDQRSIGMFVKYLTTTLLVAVATLSVIGIVGARSATPPPPVAGSVMLGVCALAAIGGLLVLWGRRAETH